MRVLIFFGSILMVLMSGCAIHNTPDTLGTAEAINPNVVSGNSINFFVDQNGTLYPNGWEAQYGSPCKFYCWGIHYSLQAIANAKGQESVQYLAAEENRIVSDVKNALSQIDRLFILVHGYNNDAKESKGNYEKIMHLLDLGERDTVVEFFWDGLVSKSSLVGDAKIWFNATGYSQLAGAEGLRDLLNAVSNKEIFIISHSRGASVALSALSNPPYGETFANETWDTHAIAVFNSKPLKDRNNKIKLLLLAPAIGDIDFKKPSYYLGEKSYRDLGAQLVSISYTVNQNDSILKKILSEPNVSGKFNPTDFGYRIEAGESVKAHYGNITSYDFSNTQSHKFSEYIENKNFIKMLIEAGIGVK
jgi:hypothetical protein